MFGFLGPNGAGKTTTIRLLLDFLRPTRGWARVLAADPRTDGVAARRRIGYLPGELRFDGRGRVEAYLRFLADARGGVSHRQIKELADRFELDLGRRIHDLSKGNKQKVGLVQAFMHEPELLVLDEPTSGLDPLMQQEFLTLVREARTTGQTVFMSSHLLAEVQHTADRVGIVRGGRLVAVERVESLGKRAERFGVLLSGGHVVTVASRATPFAPGDPVADRVEAALVARFGARNVLVTTRDELLVCVTPSALRGVPGELAHQMVTEVGPDGGWRVGVGRQHSGAGGVLHSYEEARNALHLADRLGLRATVLHAADLLVFPVLLRDRAAIDDLIGTVLGPLAGARGGAGPLIETLTAFFDTHGNTTATARRLGISVRAVGYRLDRVQRLTGYSPTEPTQRFTLEAAVLGARLLDWPARGLPSG